MKYKRIEVYQQPEGKWTGPCYGMFRLPTIIAARMMCEADLYAPIDFRPTDPTHRYFFTKKGWRIVGKRILARLKQHEIPHRVVNKKALEVPYRDQLQAVIPVSEIDYARISP